MSIPQGSFFRYTAHGHNTSSCIDGPYDYNWICSDGFTAEGISCIKAWPTPGNYTLTVYCNNLTTGEKLEKTILVEVTAVIVSDFTLGLDGWAAVADGTASIENGILKLTDLAQGQITYLGAPAKYLGNKLDYYNGKIKFTLKVNYFIQVFDSGAIQMIGGGLTLVATLPGNGTITPNVWTDFEYNLNTSTPWRLSTISGALATEEQIRTVLANLTNLNICGEFSNNPDIAYLKNVAFVGPV